MKKALLLLTLGLSCTLAFSQIRFEKGYFIDMDGMKVECLIKNNDWKNNPDQIEYKSGENSESKFLTPVSAREFVIYNSSKYIAVKVNIDRSPTQVSALTSSPDPVFSEEQVFLKVLVEGKASLYSYESANLKRFFFNLENSAIEPLVFKQYIVSNANGNGKAIRKNNKFRQQLWIGLTCPGFNTKKLEKLAYQKKALINVFSEYNACSGSKVTTYEDKVKRQLINLNVRPRLNYSSLSASNLIDNTFTFDWENKLTFGIGVEGEFILPVNKGKWTILAEPTYQNYSSTTTVNDPTSLGPVVADVNYKSIELPIGIRHYFFLNERSRIFVNASALFDFPASSSMVEVTRLSGYKISELSASGGTSFAFGAGLKQGAFSIEYRWHTSRDVLSSYMTWESSYTSSSFVLGYSLFRKKS